MGSGPCERGVPLLGGARVLLFTMVLIGGLTGVLSGLLGVAWGIVWVSERRLKQVLVGLLLLGESYMFMRGLGTLGS